MKQVNIILIFLLSAGIIAAQEYHVAVTGDDNNPGTITRPFRTLSKAAEVAFPGTVITVHEGLYRERIDPPRGGISEQERIVYRAAEGEKVVIKGSEILKGWERFKGDVWKVGIPNSFFGDYNPYNVIIEGDWFSDQGRVHHTGEVYLNGISLFEVPLLEQVLDPKPLEPAVNIEESFYTWYCESDESNTYLYANFHGLDPNREGVEINVRKACFYPEKTGINYITVKGFHMSQAATQWAPPTAEQVGLIGTNWSKGWIIEDNVISHSKCTGITLGKDRASGHNIWMEDRSIDGATHYNNLIDKVLREPYSWSKKNIGSHIVRNNTIFKCEQAGICGSMGCAFSTVEGNHIYDIWIKRQFAGAEIAGIKFHGAIDALISGNRIHNALKGIWLDWMTQGTRVSRNLIYDIFSEDIFVEVNHGPFIIDNNLLLSNCVAILDGSSGGAYIHNLIVGKVVIVQQNRATPYHKPHSTSVYGRVITRNADNRFYNNIFSAVLDEVNDRMWNPWWKTRGSYGLGVYTGYLPMYVDGNVYYNGAERYPGEQNAIFEPDFDPMIRIEDKGDEVYLHMRWSDGLTKLASGILTTERLGRVKTSDAWYEKADGNPIVFERDYSGNTRKGENPVPGPFEGIGTGETVIRVW
jgi:hypothetical protein